MQPSDPTQPVLRRRSLLQMLTLTSAFSGAGLGKLAWAQMPASASTDKNLADTWRVLSRLGYGPNPNLLRAVQSSTRPRSWALQQVDAAYRASQQAPLIATDLRTFNEPLPQLIDRARAEREARQKANGTEKDAAEAQAARKLDFSDASDPVYFSRTVSLQAAAWRLTACASPDDENPLLARMTEFWFNHFNVHVGKGAVRPFVGHYVVNVARAHALGKFEDLVLASAQHPAMLLYLDQAQSVAEGSRAGAGNRRSRGLNENYARELMELHTLGVDGGYTQTDVREMARVLTGWTVSPQESNGFRFVDRLHDSGKKQVLGRKFPAGPLGTGVHEGEDAIRMLARHPSTARRISLRLAQFFVADNPSPELVQRLSDTFLSTQGDMRAVMRTLLESTDFWNTDHRLFKTPMDYVCSALVATDAAQDRRRLVLSLGFLSNAGQPLHGWQTPDGYKFDAATWLVPEALTRRADYALAVAKQVPALEFLAPFLSDATRQFLAQEKPPLRAGLALASPDFMYK